MALAQRKSGVWGRKRRFSIPWLRELAGQIEREFEEAFRPYAATFKITPMTVSRLTEVGEGVELSLLPDDPKTWQWWGDFESSIEIVRRRRFTREWQEVLSREQVISWLRSETEEYLAQLRRSVGPPTELRR